MPSRFLARNDMNVGKCKSVTHGFPLCLIDIFTVAAVIVFIWYVVWGVPLTLKLVGWCKARRNIRAQPSVFQQDVERCPSLDDQKEIYDGDLLDILPSSVRISH